MKAPQIEDFLLRASVIVFMCWFATLLPNQELSGAKSELQGETVGLWSFYRRVDQLPYNSALRRM